MTTPHILIVDDNQMNTMLLDRILKLNYETHVAYDGHTALNKLAQQHFDLILLDIMMPGINGLDVLRIIRKNHNSSELPVILISALTEREHIVEGLKAGANDYINKPIEPEIVMARVETQIELKALADERRFMLENLERANMMRNRLMRIASHDLKNPLNSMGIALQILEADGTNDDHADILKLAHKSVQQMHSIIMEFLDMDILKEDDVNVQLQPVSIDETLRDVIETFQYQAIEKQIRMIYTPIAGKIIADPKRLIQVLNNLVSNAIKYSPCAGVVEIAIESSGDAVRIHILDSGQGIPLDEQDQLFKPFAKVSTRPTANEDSTGLGLWIAQQMMHMQQGEIGVYSVVGEGSDFWIELPMSLEAESRPELELMAG